MACACSLLLKEASFLIHLIYFDHSFDHPHINVVTFVPIRQSKKPHSFSTKKQFFVQKVFDTYLLIGLSSMFSQNSRTFFLFDFFGIKPGSHFVLRIVGIGDSYDFPILGFLQPLRFLGQPGSHSPEESPAARGIEKFYHLKFVP